MVQGYAFQELHHNERLACILGDFVDGANVGMVQRGRSSRFTAEAFQGLRIFRDVPRQELQRDKAAEFEVFSLVDHTHPAATEFLDDAVVRDGLADHLARILRARKDQVNESRGDGENLGLLA